MSNPTLTLDKLKRYVLYILARRDYATGELQQKCLVKGYASEDIEHVIGLCQENGWLDDAEYAQKYARLQQEKGVGPLKISYNLKSKKVDSRHIEAALRAIREGEFTAARLIAEKKVGNLDTLGSVARQKLARYLSQRGFGWETIRAVVGS